MYFVGSKDERARRFQQEILPQNFNVCVTTYEFIMRDRTKLCKLNWEYIIIDEAQVGRGRTGRGHTGHAGG